MQKPPTPCPSAQLTIQPLRVNEECADTRGLGDCGRREARPSEQGVGHRPALAAIGQVRGMATITELRRHRT